MAITYSSAVKDARMNAVKDAIDGDVGAGFIEICTAAYASVLATIALSDPCGSVSAGVLTLTMPKSDTSADNTGTAAIARIKDNSGDVIVSGLTVSTSGADINLTSLAITTGDTVTLTAATLTHAA